MNVDILGLLVEESDIYIPKDETETQSIEKGQKQSKLCIKYSQKNISNCLQYTNNGTLKYIIMPKSTYPCKVYGKNLIWCNIQFSLNLVKGRTAQSSQATSRRGRMTKFLSGFTHFSLVGRLPFQKIHLTFPLLMPGFCLYHQHHLSSPPCI